jgi:hypothetical protein
MSKWTDRLVCLYGRGGGNGDGVFGAGARVRRSTRSPDGGARQRVRWCGRTRLPYAGVDEGERPGLPDGPRLSPIGPFARRLGRVAPAGCAEWQGTANRGAEAAGRGDVAGVKEACRACHAAHRKRFKHELRSRRLFP